MGNKSSPTYIRAERKGIIFDSKFAYEYNFHTIQANAYL